MFQSVRFINNLNKVLQFLVIGYQGVILAAFMTIPFLANVWNNTPFIGAFVEQTLVFNGNGVYGDDPAWALFQQVEERDRLLAIDGTEVRNPGDPIRALRGYQAGDTVTITYQTPQGEILQTDITLHRFSSKDLVQRMALFTGYTPVWVSAPALFTGPLCRGERFSDLFFQRRGHPAPPGWRFFKGKLPRPEGGIISNLFLCLSTTTT